MVFPKGNRYRTSTSVVLAALVLLPFVVLAERAAAQQESDFFTVTPCRVYDTRWGAGPLTGGFDRWIPVGGYCGIPPDASAAAFNLTAVTPSGNGFLSAYPCCPYVQDFIQGLQTERTLAGLGLLRLGEGGKVAARLDASYSTTAHLVADVSGYFRPAAPVQQWREWEETLLSPADYTLNGGAPYSEVELDIRFTNTAAGLSFVQPAYWDGDELSPRIFKVSTAVPAGNWTWKIESCTRNGLSCLSGWAPNQGSFLVQSNTASGNPLYDRGFVEQVETMVGGQIVAFSAPVFPDGSKFDWIGDTAWVAPPREISGQTNAWDAYVADRKSKQFTGIQIAPAVAWTLGGSSEPLPVAKGFSFDKRPGCADTVTIPNTSCWVPRKAYWDRFVAMVRKANQAGLLVAVVGMMNPVGIDPDLAYPDPESAKVFARYLVGRLGGLAVMYSPAFDDDPDKTDEDTGQPRSVLMEEVGSFIKNKIPKPFLPGRRRALGNLLAGADSTCDDYQPFGGSGWMTHYLFQSGHGGRNQDPGVNPCAGRSADRVENAMERARIMPLTLSSYAPKLPTINGEGPYDNTDFSTVNPGVDTRYRLRQAGYLSTLSNAVGFTYGAHGLTLWDDPANNSSTEPAKYFNLLSAGDMTRLKSNLQGHGLLVSHPEWILNNPSLQKYKMVLASNEVSFVMAYLPGDEGSAGASSQSIKIDATKLPCQVCPAQNASPWSFTWINPVTNRAFPSKSCSGPIEGQMTLERPGCVTTPPDNNPNCDWVLKIEKTTGNCPSAAQGSEESSSLEVWSDTSAGDGTSAIYASSRGPAASDGPILLSPPGRAFQARPRVDRLGKYHLAVWQADGLDGSLYGIHGSLIGPHGDVVGPFKINHYSEHDQREPAVAGGVRGEALVVWTSYGQDGDKGGIFGRIVKAQVDSGDLPLEPLGEEFQIAELRDGHQQNPHVLADAGGFWVAWETVDGSGMTRRLSVRRLGLDGRPEDAEVRLPAGGEEQSTLLMLDTPSPRSVVVRWWRKDARGDLVEKLQQEIGPSGPMGPRKAGE